MSDQQALIGKWLRTYEIQALVGRGGMAGVFKAFDHNLQRLVAIKILSASAAAQHGFAERFRQEALLIARLHHPNIVQVYDYGEQDGLTFMVEELLPGPTLSKQLADTAARYERLSREQVVKIVRDIANGLQAAHQAGIIHRDIKPDNAIWNARGDLVLTDFGIARVLTGTPSNYTQTGTIVGTPTYMSPEQAQGFPLTPASDVYSLGVVLYELLTGRVPFVGSAPIAVVMAHMQDPPPAPREIRPDLPPAVEEVVLRALAKQPEQRFANPTELAYALEQAWPASYQAASRISGDIHQQPTAVWPPRQEAHSNYAPVVPRADSASTNGGRRLRLMFGLIGSLALLLLCGATMAARGFFASGSVATPVAGVVEEPTIVVNTATTEAIATPTVTTTPEPTVPPTVTPTPVPLGLTKPIAFASLRTGNWELYRVNADGSNLQPLTNNDAEDVSPDWSPNGQLIAFQSNRDGDEDIFVVNADGSEPRNLTNNKYDDRDPVWSPDGQFIAYYARPAGNWNIFVMNADGSNPHQITSELSDEFLPTWSPDGQWIAFTANAGRNDEIHIIRPDGNDRRNITNSRSADKFPAWSPDGSQIAFATDRDGNWEIYTMSPDGGNLRNLSNNPAGEAEPSWSPDRLFLAFTSNRDGKSEIYTMNADGSNQVNISNSAEDEMAPSWGR